MSGTSQSPIGQPVIGPDGPQESFGRPAHSGSTPRRRGGLLPIAISIMSCLVSLGAMIVALRALDQANDARDLVLALQSRPQVSNAVPTSPSGAATTGAAPAPVETSTGVQPDPTSTAVPDLNPETRYTVKYERETLDLQWPKGCSSGATNADLDEPRVIVGQASSADIKVGACDTPLPQFQLQGGAQGALLSSTTATPQECAERIQKGPLRPDSEIPARLGQIFCVLTDFSTAQAAGDTRKMIRVEVTGVATNERISIEATAWIIP